ncbi:unnamed protein product [Allacma fusca]|uniref:Uncharacterized protein n=1 Tax=Allacma fusca TaxID=39272 RepID=A0A8J2NN43_9HEXA|nr:unnamed protein product [Allacma fusca]
MADGLTQNRDLRVKEGSKVINSIEIVKIFYQFALCYPLQFVTTICHQEIKPPSKELKIGLKNFAQVLV